jgi:DNA (cytosine-5)-methyltransferase 1
LETPAKEYKRFFERFTWVADLAKHVIDFMLIMAEKDIKVSIHHFQKEFRAWLITLRGSSAEFANWLAKHPSGDFRTSVVANIAFIYKEAFSVLGQKEAYFHTIWDEVLDFAMYPKQPLIENACSALTRNKTIVTDYIHQLFFHLPFGDQLQASTISLTSQTLRDRIILDSHLERAPCLT